MGFAPLQPVFILLSAERFLYIVWLISSVAICVSHACYTSVRVPPGYLASRVCSELRVSFAPCAILVECRTLTSANSKNFPPARPPRPFWVCPVYIPMSVADACPPCVESAIPPCHQCTIPHSVGCAFCFRAPSMPSVMFYVGHESACHWHHIRPYHNHYLGHTEFPMPHTCA